MAATPSQPPPPFARAARWFSSKEFRIACLYGSLFLLAVGLPLLRQTGTRSWQTIWAEDGSIYFSQAKLQGSFAVLLQGHNGYLQLAPRVLGAFATLVPIRELPIYLALAGTLTYALLAWFCYYACAGWVTSQPVRLALAALVVLMPALGGENTANTTNTIWPFAAVAPWALISLRERTSDIVIRGIVVFFAATSTALCFVLVPLAVGYALVRKTRSTWVVAGVFLAGLSVQLAVVLHTTASPSVTVHPSASLLARLTGSQVFGVFLLGERPIIALWTHHSGLVAFGSILCVGVIFALLLPGAGRRNQLMATVFVAYGMVTYLSSVWERGLNALGYPLTLSLAVDNRYSVIPVLMLASAAAMLIAPPGAGKRRVVTRVGPPIFAAYCVVLIVTGFSVTNGRSSDPAWPTSVSQTYQLECVGKNPGKIVQVDTEKPSIFGSPFAVPVPCRDLAP